jgi:cytochrome P450
MLRYDPTDPQWASDPWPLYAELREAGRLQRSEQGFWVVTRHADCQALLRDRRASSDSTQVDITKVPPAGLRRSVADDDGSLAQAEVDNRPFLFRDPPDHTRLRGLVAKAFTPKMIDGLRARTEAIVAELLDAALERGELDVVADLAYPLPVRIICEMLGVPVADHERFQGWSAALARGLDPEFLLTEEVIAARMEAITSFGLYLLELLAERRANPGDDLLSQLALAEEEGDTLSEEELISTAILLLVAGHETTVNLIAGGVLSLVQHPVQLERLRSDPSVVRSGVEEMLRYVSPVQLTGRTLLEPMTVGEADLEAGEFVIILIGSANRDPLVFTDPEVFDLGRAPNHHLGFGFGIHHCLGAPLARLEAQVAIPELLRRVETIELVEDRPSYRRNVVLRGLETLPVRLTAA